MEVLSTQSPTICCCECDGDNNTFGHGIGFGSSIRILTITQAAHSQPKQLKMHERKRLFHLVNVGSTKLVGYSKFKNLKRVTVNNN